jgi:hypothetical protein
MINSYKGPYGSIITKDLAPTSTKPARIRATASTGKTIIVSRTITGDYLSDHCAAARELADSFEYGTDEDMIPGTIKNGFVFVIDTGMRV